MVYQAGREERQDACQKDALRSLDGEDSEPANILLAQLQPPPLLQVSATNK